MPSCRHCQTAFEVTDEDLAFLLKVSPVIAGKRHEIPPPTLCFDCRLQRRLSFYNNRSLYRRTCGATGATIVSIYSPDKPFTVYDKKYWFSDAWDPLQYGRPFDFSRSFSAQLRELMESVPAKSLEHFGMDNVNSDYTNDNYKVKDCYLVFDGEQAEDCMYGNSYVLIRSCIDFLFLHQSELCYECTYCDQSYNLRYSRFCRNSSDSWFLRDCIGCKNCFGCANLRQKQFCIFNEQKTQEEYAAFLSAFRSQSRAATEEMRVRAEEFFQSQPVRATRGEQNVNVTGDNVGNSKNAYYCFDCLSQEDCRYCTGCMMNAKDCMDVNVWGDGLELCYDSCVVGAQARNLLFDYSVSQGSTDILYSLFCSLSSSHLFGCVGLRRKKYCILNNQYTKEEYEALVPAIIEHMRTTGEWGEFFPAAISPFGYNETVAQTFYPLKEEDVLSKGWHWCDYEMPVDAKKSVPASQLPDDIDAIGDEITDWAILCARTGKPFKTTKREMEFYREHRLPVPVVHPNERHRLRTTLRNPRKLWMRPCMKCTKETPTTYAPGRPEVVYCEDCYLKEVY